MNNYIIAIVLLSMVALFFFIYTCWYSSVIDRLKSDLHQYKNLSKDLYILYKDKNTNVVELITINNYYSNYWKVKAKTHPNIIKVTWDAEEANRVRQWEQSDLKRIKEKNYVKY